MKSAVPVHNASTVLILILAALGATLTSAMATVAVSPLYGNNMVIQRDKPFPVRGIAAPNKTITISYNSQTANTTSDAFGNWQVALPAMSVKTSGSNLTITEAGANTITLSNVVVGDVWLCSGQSNMAFTLSGCGRPTDISSANFPGIRCLTVPTTSLGDPTTSLSASWSVCSSSTAGGYSAVAFYFGRKIYQDQNTNVPIGLIVSSVGGTCIDPWLAPEGVTDIPVLAPLYSQAIPNYGPFSLFNGMIYPLAPYPMKGAIWYQGEARQTTSQSNDSYYLKEKGLQQGWKRLMGLNDFALYVVLLANYGTVNTSVTPETIPGTGWADTRLQQVNVVGLPHAGVASALDVGNPGNIHPTDKLDVGERLALWALKNDYGRTTTVPSGPILQDVTISGTNLICSFNYVGAGLMVGSKTNYLPTAEVVGGVLTNFSIAGASGSWYAANATITSSNTVVVSSPSVATPRKVAYACWQSPVQLNFYNRDGLPANPFYVDDATAKYTVTASAGAGGSISPSGGTTYLKRMTALYTITPDAGNYILDVKVDGASVGAVRSYTFDPLYANHTIAATFTNAQPSYTITASAAPGGTISPAGAVAVAQGGSQTFLIMTNTGYKQSVTVDGCPMGVRTNFMFTDSSANHTIAATFSPIITATATAGGTISPSGTLVVNYGANQTFTITQSIGYVYSQLTVDGTNQGAPSSYTFTNITAGHTISATFSGPFTNTITASAGVGGSISPTGAVSVLYGASQAFMITSNALGYAVSGVTVDGVPKGAITGYTFTNVITNHTIAAAFIAIPTYTITSSAGTNGSISPSGSVIVNSGSSPTFSIIPNTGYGVSSVTVDGSSVGAVSSYTFTNLSTNHTISAAFFALPTFTITATAGTNGSISPAGAVPVYLGSSQTFTITPNSGYSISGVTADGASVGPVSSYTFTNVTTNHTLAASFVPYTGPTPIAFYPFENNVNDAQGAYNGTAYGSPTYVTGKIGSSAIQFNGTSQYVTISRPVSDSFTIAFWVKTTQTSPTGTQWYNGKGLVDGEVGGTQNDFGISYLNSKVAFGVGSTDTTFQSTNTINSGNWVHVACTRNSTNGQMKIYLNGVLETTGTGPTGTKSAPTTLHFGNLQTTINYFNGALDQVKIYNSVLSAADISYLASEVTSYMITASAGANGSISPGGPVAVNSGANQAFTISPNTGYAVSQVAVDGVNKGALSAYTFTNVVANHTISATFASVTPPTLSITRNGTGGIDILWPTNTYFGSLLTSPVLGPAARWTAVTNVPTPAGAFYKVTVTPGSAAAFYGLAH